MPSQGLRYRWGKEGLNPPPPPTYESRGAEPPPPSKKNELADYFFYTHTSIYSCFQSIPRNLVLRNIGFFLLPLAVMYAHCFMCAHAHARVTHPHNDLPSPHVHVHVHVHTFLPAGFTPASYEYVYNHFTLVRSHCNTV